MPVRLSSDIHRASVRRIKFSPEKTTRSTTRSFVPATQQLNRKAQTSRSQRLTVQKKMRQTRKVPFELLAPPNGACANLPSHPTTACLTTKKQENSTANHLAQRKTTNHLQITSCLPLPSRSQLRPTPSLSAAPPTRPQTGS